MIEKEILLKEYIENNKTSQQIAKELNKSKNEVLYWLESYGIERKRTSSYTTIDLTGKKFGDYTVLEKDNSKKYCSWKCQCSCGTIKSIKSQTLRNNEARSCGKCKPRHNSTTYKEISGHYWARIKYGAKIRNIIFNITQQQIWDLYIKQNKKCAISGVEISFCKDRKTYIELQTASIDRIDSNKDYTIDNVQLVHKDVNRLKGDLTEDKLLYWVKNIYENCKINTSR